MDGVTINKWKDAKGVVHNNYNCNKCQFATLDEQAMRLHVWQEDHRWPKAAKEEDNN